MKGLFTQLKAQIYTSLSEHYRTGNAPSDTEKAKTYAQEAIQSGDRHAYTILGGLFEKENNIAQAMKVYSEGANALDLTSFYLLKKINNSLVKAKNTENYELLALSYYYLGTFYETIKDWDKAFQYYQNIIALPKTIEDAIHLAKYQLALMMIDGHIPEQKTSQFKNSPIEGIKILSEIAIDSLRKTKSTLYALKKLELLSETYPEAILVVARLYAKFNYEKTITYYEIASKKGYMEADFYLGEFYLKHEKTDLALQHYFLAAEKGHIESAKALLSRPLLLPDRHRLAQIFCEKFNNNHSAIECYLLEKNFRQIKQYLNDFNYRDDCFFIAQQVEQIHSMQKAAFFYEKAANQGHDQAAYKFGIYHNSIGNFGIAFHALIKIKSIPILNTVLSVLVSIIKQQENTVKAEYAFKLGQLLEKNEQLKLPKNYLHWYREAAVLDHSGAILRLDVLAETLGDKIFPLFKNALKYRFLKIALQHHNKSAFAYLSNEAKDGNKQAQTLLLDADCDAQDLYQLAVEFGEAPLETDQHKAMEIQLYEKAAQAGHSQAKFNLAQFLLKGKFISKNKHRACQLFIQSGYQVPQALPFAEKILTSRQDAQLEFEMAELFVHLNNISAALSWYQKAASHNNHSVLPRLRQLAEKQPDMILQITELCENIDSFPLFHGQQYTFYELGLMLKIPQVIERVCTLAENNDSEAQYLYGVILFDKGLCESNSAFEWCLKAAIYSSHAKSLNYLENYTYTGEQFFNHAQSIEDTQVSGAIILYTIAAKKGYPLAYLHLGHLYVKNQDTLPGAFELAWLNFSRAVKTGYLPGLALLEGLAFREINAARYLELGEIFRLNNYPLKAFEWFEKAAYYGNPQAKEKLQSQNKVTSTATTTLHSWKMQVEEPPKQTARTYPTEVITPQLEKTAEREHLKQTLNRFVQHRNRVGRF
jgi:TPR repeat protein